MGFPQLFFILIQMQMRQITNIFYYALLCLLAIKNILGVKQTL